jgi:hypothetical protein
MSGQHCRVAFLQIFEEVVAKFRRREVSPLSGDLQRTIRR